MFLSNLIFKIWGQISVKFIIIIVQVIIGDAFMKLQYFAFILILFLFVAGINAAYIDEISTGSLKDIQYPKNDTSVSLNGINFTIPAGFGLIENESVNCVEDNHTVSERVYANGAKEIIVISTESIVRHDLILSDYTPCDVDMVAHAVNGHEGIEWSMDNGTYFIYFDNDCLVTVGSSNGSYFEDIIQ